MNWYKDSLTSQQNKRDTNDMAQSNSSLMDLKSDWSGKWRKVEATIMKQLSRRLLHDVRLRGWINENAVMEIGYKKWDEADSGDLKSPLFVSLPEIAGDIIAPKPDPAGKKPFIPEYTNNPVIIQLIQISIQIFRDEILHFTPQHLPIPCCIINQTTKRKVITVFHSRGSN